MAAEQKLKDADLDGALVDLQEQIRAEPAASRHRIFLFQLLGVLGRWDRALLQLETLKDLDPKTVPMVQTYRQVLRCEMRRAEVFGGRESPLLIGDPEQWMAGLLESLRTEAVAHGDRAKVEAAQALRLQAINGAPELSGSLNGERFLWLANADSRLGPMLEAIINGKYYWVPFSRLREVKMEAPQDLRDIIWAPAHLTFANGGETVAFLPARYPGSELSVDGLIRLGRKTEWRDMGAQTFTGLGQVVLASDAADTGLLDVRTILFDGGGLAAA